MARKKLKLPAKWTDDERQRIARAISEHRLNRVDLYLWQEADHRGRNLHDLAVEFMLNRSEISARIARARAQIEATFARPSQEEYLGKWINT